MPKHTTASESVVTLHLPWARPKAKPRKPGEVSHPARAGVFCGFGVAAAAAWQLPDPGWLCTLLLLTAAARPSRWRDVAPALLCAALAVTLSQALLLPGWTAAAAAALAGALSFNAANPWKSAVETLAGVSLGGALGAAAALTILPQLDSVTGLILVVAAGSALAAELAAPKNTHRDAGLPFGAGFLLLLLTTGGHNPYVQSADLVNRWLVVLLGTISAAALSPILLNLDPSVTLARGIANTLNSLVALMPNVEFKDPLVLNRRFQADLLRAHRRLNRVSCELSEAQVNLAAQILDRIRAAGFALSDISAHSFSGLVPSTAFCDAENRLNIAIQTAIVQASRLALGKTAHFPDLIAPYESFIATASREMMFSKEPGQRTSLNTCILIYGEAMQIARSIIELISRKQ